MSLSRKYDFIFLGAGCASLSLVMRMIKSGKFNDKKILLIDKEQKIKNDRTWCFWEKQAGFFEDIIYKKWSKLSFYSEEFTKKMDISPYQYKMIRAIDFYDHCFKKIEEHTNIEVQYGEVKFVHEPNKLSIFLDYKQLSFDNTIVFNSIFSANSGNTDNEIFMLQHFKGWIIETDIPAFEPGEATFMDFRVDQEKGTTFVYVLPFSENQALIEYTLFSEKVLTEEEYEKELKVYVNDFLKIHEYKILEKEFGVIPMTNRKFKFYQDSIYNIGTAGGQTKASSGYTFQFIQKQSDLILEHLLNGESLNSVPKTPNRFTFYDKVLLDVLDKKRISGKTVFSTMFKKNKPQQVLKFLDNESTLAEELKIISTLPTIPFVKAALNQL